MASFTKLFGRRLLASALTVAATLAVDTASGQTPASEGAERVRDLLKNERLLSETAGGGVWRTTNRGATWTLANDALGTGFQVGAVAIAPSDTGHADNLSGSHKPLFNDWLPVPGRRIKNGKYF